MAYYNDYTTMSATFTSTCSCGTKIKKGDQIAWARGQKAMCMDCFNAWSVEVRDEMDLCSRYQEQMGVSDFMGAW